MDYMNNMKATLQSLLRKVSLRHITRIGYATSPIHMHLLRLDALRMKYDVTGVH